MQPRPYGTSTYSINIHAAHASCDRERPFHTSSAADFNPRSPCGLRRFPISMTSLSPEFQSTQPMRAATSTAPPRRSRRHFNPRSPCGLRLKEEKWKRTDLRFQSTQPMRAATSRRWICSVDNLFQSTQPMRAATDSDSNLREIEINFNPRSPCGLRRYRF